LLLSGGVTSLKLLRLKLETVKKVVQPKSRSIKSTKKLEVKGYSGVYNCHKYWGKKPVELYELILDEFTENGSLVCDPFVGSGVLPSVCLSRGISFDGCDLNPAAIEVAKIFIEPPSKGEVKDILEIIKSVCQQRINETYTLNDGTLISHIVWNEFGVDEVWTKVGRSTKLLPLDKKIEKQLQFAKTFKPKYFKDRELNKNSRINVEEGQMVSDLFTQRALHNIDLILGAISDLGERQQRIAKFILTSSLGQMSRMVFTIANRRAKKTSEPQKKYEVGSWVIGYWRPKTYFEINVWNVFEGRAVRLINSLSDINADKNNISKSTVNLECEDAVEHLKKLKKGSVDLLVTDPPHSDRIPYLELSEMWNTFLGFKSDLHSEFIYSNSSKRDKTLQGYLVKLDNVIEQVGRVLADGGCFVLIFNTTETVVWDAIKNSLNKSKDGLQYLGRFSADYSSGSVVQDNREGALVNDWCLVVSKGKPTSKFSTSRLPSWTKEWI